MAEVKMNLPDPPEGWEYTGEFGRLGPGESGVATGVSGEVIEYEFAKQLDFRRPVFKVRRVPSLPVIGTPTLAALIRPGWLAKDDDGVWHWFADKPEFRNGAWCCPGRGGQGFADFDTDMFDPERLSEIVYGNTLIQVRGDE